MPCLHEHMRRLTYDEQRELECETFESAYERQSQKNLSMKKENDDEGEVRTDQSGSAAAD